MTTTKHTKSETSDGCTKLEVCETRGGPVAVLFFAALFMGIVIGMTISTCLICNSKTQLLVDDATIAKLAAAVSSTPAPILAIPCLPPPLSPCAAFTPPHDKGPDLPSVMKPPHKNTPTPAKPQSKACH